MRVTDSGCNARRAERDIATLLKNARDPKALCALPFARSLCEELALPDAATMVHALVNGALGDDPKRAHMYEAIRLCHFREGQTKARAARSMHLSMRHFYRVYTVAVKALVDHLERARARAPLAMDPVPTEHIRHTQS